MKPFFICFFLLVFTMFHGKIQSQVLYVDSSVSVSGNGSSWSNPLKSLGDALDSAHKNPNFETILVAKGTYFPTRYAYDMIPGMIGYENITGRTHEKTFHIRVGLKVFGGYPNGGGTRDLTLNPTILSGYLSPDTTNHVVYMDSSDEWTKANDTSILDGFIIMNGIGKIYNPFSLIINGNNITFNRGGGIYINKGSQLIKNCTIKNNFTEFYGGGLSSYVSNTTIQNCTFVNNRTDSSDDNSPVRGGGGINMFGSHLNILNSNFKENYGIRGGAILAQGGTMNLNNSLIERNQAIFYGGGLYLDGGDYSINRNKIIKNSTLDTLNPLGGGGGGIHIFNAKTIISNNSIDSNSTFANGGGVYDNSYLNITNYYYNNLIVNNSAGDGGGGIGVLDVNEYIINNTIYGNKCEGGGGGLNISNSLYIRLYNNVFWNNKYRSSPDSFGSDLLSYFSPLVRNNLFQIDSNKLQPYFSSSSHSNFFHLDPLFKGGNGIDKYSFLPNSLLYDKGDSSLFIFLDSLDYFSTDRIINNNIDIGAIEGLTCNSHTILFDTICFKDTVFFAGNFLRFTGVYSDTIINVFSCDSFVTLNLLVQFPDTTYLVDTICSNQNYTFNNKTITTTGIYWDTLANNYGCDSFIELALTVIPIATKSLSTSICAGTSYYFNNSNLNVAGIYLDTFSTANGCDSIITLNLTIKPTSSSTINSTICKGMTFLFNGVQRSTSGTYLDTFIASNGCDSIVTLNLTITPATIITKVDSSDFSSAYTWRGKPYSSAGIYYDTSKAANQCDTIFKLILTAKTPVPPAAPPILQINYVAGALIASIDSATSYQWYLCGPPMKKITGATKRTFQVSYKNKYTVVVSKNSKTDTATCASNSSIVSAIFDEGIIYYPNPVINKLYIEQDKKLINVDIAISDLAGRILWTHHYNSFMQIEISMQNFLAGTYFLHILSDQISNRVFKIEKKDE